MNVIRWKTKQTVIQGNNQGEKLYLGAFSEINFQ